MHSKRAVDWPAGGENTTKWEPKNQIAGMRTTSHDCKSDTPTGKHTTRH